MISLKSASEIEQMQAVGQAAADVLFSVEAILEPGITTNTIAGFFREQLRATTIEPLFLHATLNNRLPFPDVCCVSVNEELSHGIPGERVLANGDLVTIDFGGRQAGWCVDVAHTWGIGCLSQLHAELLAECEALLQTIIDQLETCRWWSEMISVLQHWNQHSQFSLIEHFPGHGIGRELHEEPQLPLTNSSPHFVDVELVPGLVVAVEPMLTAGVLSVGLSADADRTENAGSAENARSNEWTVVTLDGAPCVHFEQTVAITENGIQQLTLPKT